LSNINCVDITVKKGTISGATPQYVVFSVLTNLFVTMPREKKSQDPSGQKRSKDPFSVVSGKASLYPADKRCPVCKQGFQDGLAYLMAGACPSEDSQDWGDKNRLEGFLHIGVLGGAQDCTQGAADVIVAEDVHGGQFDLNWCSIDCMRQWLLNVLAEVERRAKQTE
jgi:hypothetical protein